MVIVIKHYDLTQFSKCIINIFKDNMGCDSKNVN